MPTIATIMRASSRAVGGFSHLLNGGWLPQANPCLRQFALSQVEAEMVAKGIEIVGVRAVTGDRQIRACTTTSSL